MSDGIFKRMMRALNAKIPPEDRFESAARRIERETASAANDAASTINLLASHPQKPQTPPPSRLAFVYQPDAGPSQTMTRFALCQKHVQLAKVRFGETRQSVSEVFDSEE